MEEGERAMEIGLAEPQPAASITDSNKGQRNAKRGILLSRSKDDLRESSEGDLDMGPPVSFASD